MYQRNTNRLFCFLLVFILVSGSAFAAGKKKTTKRRHSCRSGGKSTTAKAPVEAGCPNPPARESPLPAP